MSAQLTEALRDLLAKVRRDAPDLSGKLLGYCDAVLAAHEAAPQQEPVAWINECVIEWLKGRGKTASITTTLQAHKSAGRPMPIYAAPQHAGRADAQPVDKLDALRLDLARAHDSANGFVDEIKRLKQQVRELEAFRAMVNRHQPEFPADPDGPRDVWYWQGDHMDHLESMTHTLPVVIRAEQLRELLAARAEKGGA